MKQQRDREPAEIDRAQRIEQSIGADAGNDDRQNDQADEDAENSAKFHQSSRGQAEQADSLFIVGSAALDLERAECRLKRLPVSVVHYLHYTSLLQSDKQLMAA